MTPPSALRLSVVDSTAGLERLGADWTALAAQAETDSPFLSHEWALSWWESFGAEHSLRVLVLEDDDGLAGLAPFTLARRSAGPVSYRALELIGTGPLRFLGMGLADRADLVLARRPADCLAAVATWLAAVRDGWDVLDLRFVPEGSSTVRLLPALARAQGLGVASEPCSDSPYLPLAGTWDDYLAERGSNFRKGLRRKLRKLEERGAVTFDLHADEGPAFDAAFAEAVVLGSASWKGRAGTALLQHENVREFFARLLPRLRASGGLYLALVRLDGRAVAHELGFRRSGKLWSYDSCFDPTAGEGSPGVLLTARLLEESWSLGLREYDFMRGGESYKLDWRGSTRREVQLVVDSGTPRGQLARRVAYEAKWLLKRQSWLARWQGQLVGALNRLLLLGRGGQDGGDGQAGAGSDDRD